jgi:hypothetical protein
MCDRETGIDREASEAIRRMERQQFLDGKLDKADATEGAAILFMPVVLAAVGLVGRVLSSLGLEGPGMIFVGVPILIGLGVLVACLNRR